MVHRYWSQLMVNWHEFLLLWICHLLAQLGDGLGVVQHAALAGHVLLVKLLGKVPDEHGVQVSGASARSCSRSVHQQINTLQVC